MKELLQEIFVKITCRSIIRSLRERYSSRGGTRSTHSSHFSKTTLVSEISVSSETKQPLEELCSIDADNQPQANHCFQNTAYEEGNDQPPVKQSSIDIIPLNVDESLKIPQPSDNSHREDTSSDQFKTKQNSLLLENKTIGSKEISQYNHDTRVIKDALKTTHEHPQAVSEPLNTTQDSPACQLSVENEMSQTVSDLSDASQDMPRCQLSEDNDHTQNVIERPETTSNCQLSESNEHSQMSTVSDPLDTTQHPLSPQLSEDNKHLQIVNESSGTTQHPPNCQLLEDNEHLQTVSDSLGTIQL